MEAVLAAISINDPAPGMLAGPDMDEVRKVRDELYTICEASRELRDRIPRKRERNMLWIQIAGARWYLAWSGNTQKLSGKSCRWVLCTECDKWQQSTKEGLTQDLVRERVKAFASYKIIFESTPTNETSFIADRYDESDQQQFHMPCPHCNHWQPFRFHVHTEGPYKDFGGVAGYKDSKGGLLDPDDALPLAHYLCERNCKIEEHDRAGMISQGRWVPKGQWIDRDNKLRGEAERGKRVVGFNCCSLLGKHVTFGRIAAEYCRSADDPKKAQNFVNNWEGKRYSGLRSAPQWRTIGTTLRGGHPRGQVPAPAYFLTAGCDVQANRCYWVVRAWASGTTSWLVDWGTFSQRAGADGSLIKNTELEQFYRSVICKDWPMAGGANPIGWPSLKIVQAGCDANFEPHRVWEFIRNCPGDLVRAFAGDHQMRAPFFNLSVVEKSARDGKIYTGGMKRWGINTHTYKSDLRERWQQPQEEPGFWWLPSTTLEEAEPYLRQITNEVERPKEGKPGATEWVMTEAGFGNHYWDAEVYARAAADMVTGFEWSNLMNMAEPYRPSGPIHVDHRQQTEFSAR